MSATKSSTSMIWAAALVAAACVAAIVVMTTSQANTPVRKPGNFSPSKSELRTIERDLTARFSYPRGVELGSVTGRIETADDTPFFCGFVTSENEHGSNRRTSIFHGILFSDRFVPMEIASGGPAADDAIMICCARGLFDGEMCAE